MADTPIVPRPNPPPTVPLTRAELGMSRARVWFRVTGHLERIQGRPFTPDEIVTMAMHMEVTEWGEKL